MFDQYNQALIQASYGALSLSADVAVLPEIYLPYDANVEDNFTYYEAPAVEVGCSLLPSPLLLLLPSLLLLVCMCGEAAQCPCQTAYLPSQRRSAAPSRGALPAGTADADSNAYSDLCCRPWPLPARCPGCL